MKTNEPYVSDCSFMWPRLCEAMISSGSVRQRNGHASVRLCASRKRRIAFCTCATESKTPRYRQRRESLAKNPSTALSPELAVGTMWKCWFGWDANHACTQACLWIA